MGLAELLFPAEKKPQLRLIDSDWDKSPSETVDWLDNPFVSYRAKMDAAAENSIAGLIHWEEEYFRGHPPLTNLQKTAIACWNPDTLKLEYSYATEIQIEILREVRRMNKLLQDKDD